MVLRSRRDLLKILSAGMIVGACSENPATGRRQLSLVSDATLAVLGREAWADALARMPLISDRRMLTRLERIGQAMAARSSAPAAWAFAVFDSADINAFVLPGGKVGFFRGLMESAQSDDEIAAVMGHEIGHIEARHANERMSQQLALEIGVSLAAAALSEEYGQNAETIACALGAGVLYGVVLPYSRLQELEADRLGLNLMREAGYDPQGRFHSGAVWRAMALTQSSGCPRTRPTRAG